MRIKWQYQKTTRLRVSTRCQVRAGVGALLPGVSTAMALRKSKHSQSAGYKVQLFLPDSWL